MSLLTINKAFLSLFSPVHHVYLDCYLRETWTTTHSGFSLHIAQWSTTLTIKIKITLIANGYYNSFERSTHHVRQGEGKLETGPAGRKGTCLQSTELLLYNLQIQI